MIANGYRSKIPVNTGLGCSILLSSQVTGLASTGRVAQALPQNPLLIDNWAAAPMVLTFLMPKTLNMY
jgi:hypothetical protein